jgi:hypothetical protein
MAIARPMSTAVGTPARCRRKPKRKATPPTTAKTRKITTSSAKQGHVAYEAEHDLEQTVERELTGFGADKPAEAAERFADGNGLQGERRHEEVVAERAEEVEQDDDGIGP